MLSEIPGQAHVAVLEPDATNIINVVEGGYEGITTSIQVEIIPTFPLSIEAGREGGNPSWWT